MVSSHKQAVPGTQFRIGLDPIIGLIPGLGDWITSLLSFLIVFGAYRDGVSRWTLGRMVGNIILDLFLGAIPFLGDLLDFVWKANRRNLELWDRATVSKRAGFIDFMFISLMFILVSILSGAIVYGVWTGIEMLIQAMK
jgi:hypothetical protein